MRSEHRIVGIDLGTTFSLVATLQGGRPVVLPNAMGEHLTPSAVGVADDGSLLVGAAARARATTHPDLTALSFKRDMGTDTRYRLGRHTLGPSDLSAMVLAALKRDAEVALGAPVEEAVVTVPAYFGDIQRQATRAAGEIAGLRVERIINEPTAAALAYGLHQRHREMRVAVLDLGGGTFDVTVLEVIEGVIEIHASAGDTRLGGDDFDGVLAELFAERVSDEYEVDLRADPITWARARDAAERAKRRLSEQSATGLALVQAVFDGRRLDVEARVSREEAESAWAPLLDRLRHPIERALRDPDAGPENIDEVLLVGGATRMPCVAALAAKLFGRLPLRALPPDEAVAQGAAIQAALKTGDAAVEDMVVTDIAPFSLGISVCERVGRQVVGGIFSPIIERGTVIPCSRVRRFSTAADGQEKITIEVYQGEHSLCRDNRRLGAYTVPGLRPLPAGEEAVDVRFSYDLNGILEVETTIVETGSVRTLVIEKTPGRLAPAEVAAARQRMQRLKFHPREALPNTTLLARADALFVELRGPDREILAQHIAAFRAAVELQDEETIEKARGNLAAVVASLRVE